MKVIPFPNVYRLNFGRLEIKAVPRLRDQVRVTILLDNRILRDTFVKDKNWLHLCTSRMKAETWLVYKLHELLPECKNLASM